MNHYVYRITNIRIKKHYYGTRSCECDPKNDLGFKYFSSSKDSDFILDQKNNPKDYKYKIVKIFPNRKDAVNLEIKLHNKFKVNINSSFYNKSKQTNLKFDTSGTIFIKGKLWTIDEYKKQNEIKYHTFGKVSVVDKHGNTSQINANDERLNKDLFSIQKGMINAIDSCGRSCRITKSQYYEGKYTCNNTGKVPIKYKGICKLVSTNDPKYKNKTYKHVSTNSVSAIDVKTGETKSVSKKEYDKNENLFGVNYMKINGKNNPRAKIINIYDSEDKLVCICHGNFKSTCKEKGYPFNALRRSYVSGGKKIYRSKRGQQVDKNNEKSFTGWYAIIV